MKKTLIRNLPGPFTFFAIVMAVTIATRTGGQLASQAEVNQVQGILIFTDSKPLQEYTYLGTVKAYRIVGSSQYQPVRDYLIKKIRKDYPAANGAIFHLTSGGTDHADAIKLQE